MSAAAIWAFTPSSAYSRAERSVSANGAIQSAHCDERSGMGVQVITPDGATGHACTDRITPEAAERLVEDAARLASMSQGYGARKVDGHQRMPRLITSVHCEAPMGIENFSHEEEQRLVAKASAKRPPSTRRWRATPPTASSMRNGGLSGAMART